MGHYWEKENKKKKKRRGGKKDGLIDQWPIC